ncbi:hypothetical protein N7481_007911 [Penicillium waksmanii]|uniref:uncharacterized protein n=1 Tax=Penicillium waksmanii TaxID=69791 RepID=UPI002547D709|nr:uncharacterized protein N7481_007911 [Penicillium waksmanii]KAJ5980613.1 hypothetical protein N7481_007911 [Penicillium waksmanii]
MVGIPPAQYGIQYKRVAAFQGDVNIHAARRLASQAWSVHNVSAYSYLFDVVEPGAAPKAGPYAVANHGSEIPYVFDNKDAVGKNADEKLKEGTLRRRRRLSTAMSRMWISFVTTLNPCTPREFGVKWPVYDHNDPEIMFFGLNVTGLTQVESDVYRAEGIKYISDRLESTFEH